MQDAALSDADGPDGHSKLVGNGVGRTILKSNAPKRGQSLFVESTADGGQQMFQDTAVVIGFPDVGNTAATVRQLVCQLSKIRPAGAGSTSPLPVRSETIDHHPTEPIPEGPCPAVVLEIPDFPTDIRHHFLDDVLGVRIPHSLPPQPGTNETVIELGELVPRSAILLIPYAIEQADGGLVGHGVFRMCVHVR